MSKQKKPIPLPFNFFEEMEERMQIEDSKRRKLSKKKLHSQPELLFLQFNPDGGTDFCSFSNNAYSRPSGSNPHKKSWRPPVKISNESDVPVLDKLLTKETSSGSNQLLKENSENINLFSTSNHTEDSLRDNNSNYGHVNIINDSNELENFETSSQLPAQTNVEKILDAKQILEKDKENVFSYCIKNVSVEENSTGIIPSDNVNNLCIDKQISFESISQSNVQQIIIETDSKQTMKESSGESGEECSRISISNNDNNNFDDEDVISHEPMSQPPCDNYRYHESEYKQKVHVNKGSCSYDETNNLDVLKGMSTERNLHNEENSKLERTDCHQLSVENINVNYSEHQDILNSIDMILSEGCSPEPEEFRNNTNEDTKRGQEIEEIVVKSKFENDYNFKSDDNEPNCNSTLVCEKIINLSEIEKQCKSEVTKERLLSNETEKLLNKTAEKNLNNSIEKEIEVIKDSKISNNAIDSMYNKGNSETKEINANDHPFTFLGSNDEGETVNEEEINLIQCEGEPAVDDEYSCVMISTSQLLEIERKYNETLKSAKVFNISQMSTKETTSNIFDTTGLNKTVSTSTQTEYFYNQPSVFTQQNVLPQVPPVQWPSKMLETQRKLRDIIQEIGRLNVILLKARQQMWPQRNNIENIPELLKQDNVSTNLRKKK